MEGSTRKVRAVVAALTAFVLAAGCVPEQTPPTTPPGSSTTVTLGDQTIEVTAPDGSVVTATAAPPEGLPPAPQGLEFPIGALDVQIDGVTPGSVARLTLALSQPAQTFRKLVGGAWDRFVTDGVTGGSLSPDGLTLTLDVRDGGRGDDDGLADGKIADPIALGDITSLTILTDALPLARLGEPYGPVALQAAGATGPVTWSITRGQLPPGITLDPNTGVLSGTPIDAYQVTGAARIEATDGSTTTSRFLGIFGLQVAEGPAPTTTGAALPDGTAVHTNVISYWCTTPPCPPTQWVGNYRDLGGSWGLAALSSPTSQEVMSAVPGSDPLGRRSPWVDPVEGLVVIDTDTGDTIGTIDATQTVPSSVTSFSPDGTMLAVTSVDVQTTDIFGISPDGTVQQPALRSIPLGQFYSPVVWSPDSSRLTSPDFDGFVHGATAPGLDSTVNLDGHTCPRTLDWSGSDRLLLLCSPWSGNYSIVTAPVSGDGVTDVWTVAADTCDSTGGAPPCTRHSSAAFSPSGAYVVVGSTVVYTNPVTGLQEQELTLDYYSDSPTATPTRLASAPASAVGMDVFYIGTWR